MDHIPADSKSNIKACLENLEKLLKEVDKEKEIINELRVITEECDKSVAHRVYAGVNGAYNILMNVLEKYESDIQLALPALNAQIALMTGNPDLLDKKGIDLMMHYLDTKTNVDVKIKLLEWTKVCCIKHEQNRQDIFEMNILARMKKILDSEEVPPRLVKNICCVARALTLDDDIRVHYGKGHEHAKALAAETLCTFIDFLQQFKGDNELACDIIQTLAALITNNESCQKVDEAGGLTFISDIFSQFPENEKLNRLCLKLVKGLAGNDKVKNHIVQQGIGNLVIAAMHRHDNSAGVVAAGCAAIAALCLRSPSNSKELFNSGAPEVILQGMIIHEADWNVQKQGCWAVRNMVARDKTLCKAYLKLATEDIIRTALKIHGEQIAFDAKAALRDLGIEDED